jgi:hypothetical protein
MKPVGVFIFKPSLVVALIVLSTAVFVVPANCAVTFSPADKFDIPALNSQITFAIDGSYDSANLENNTWNFVGLALDNYMLNLTRVDPYRRVLTGREVLRVSYNDGNFSALVQNCNITITSYDIWMNFAPQIGWLNYSVTGTGTQTFNLHYATLTSPTEGINWTVYINDVFMFQNDSWTISSDGWLKVSSSNSKVSIHYDMIEPPRYDIPPDATQENIKRLAEVGVFVFIIIIISIFVIRKRRKQKPRVHNRCD